MKHSLIRTAGFAAALTFIFAFTMADTISITISSPSTKSTYRLKDTVWINAHVNSTGALHDVNIKVMNLKDSSVVFSKYIHSHGTSIDIREYYINPVFEKSNMKLIISTTGHEGVESSRKELEFKCLSKK